MTAQNTTCLGIDFGSRVVAASRLSNGQLASPTTAWAAVAVHRGQVVLGDLRRLAHQPECVALDVKSQLGKPRHGTLVDGRAWRPETLAAAILKAVASPARQWDAVGITLPAFSTSGQRRAMRNAAEIAGMPQAVIVSDIAAAAAGCQARFGADAISGGALVCDLGMHAFRWGVFRAGGQGVRVERHGMYPDGAANWEQRLLDCIAEAIEDQTGASPFESMDEPIWRQQNAGLAQRLSHRLARDAAVRWELMQGETLTQGRVTRQQWETYVEPAVQAVTAELHEVARTHDVKRILFIGGVNHLPAVQLRIEQACNVPSLPVTAAKQLLSSGAAQLAMQDSESSSSTFRIADVAAEAMGVHTVDRRQKQAINKVVVEAGARLRTMRTLKIGKVADSRIVVRLLQGQAPRSEDNLPLGECHLHVSSGDDVQLRLGFDRCGEARALLIQNAGEPVDVPIAYPHRLQQSEIDDAAQWLSRVEPHVCSLHGSRPRGPDDIIR